MTTLKQRSERALARARAAFDDGGRQLELLLYVSKLAALRGLPLRLYDVPSTDDLEELLVFLDALGNPTVPEYELARFVVHPGLGILDRRHVVYDFVSADKVPPRHTVEISRILPTDIGRHLPVRLVVDEACAPHFYILRIEANRIHRLGTFDSGPATLFTGHDWPALGERLLERGSCVALRIRNVSDAPHAFQGWMISIAGFDYLAEMPATGGAIGAFATDLDRWD